MTTSLSQAAFFEVLLLMADEPPPADTAGVVGNLNRLCSALVRALPASGAGISLMGEPGGSAGVAAFAGPQSRRLEELQFTLGEGPCLDAHTQRRAVLEPDLAGAGSQRWPAYGPQAAELGVQAVFAFPLQTGPVRIGVLDVYCHDPGPLSTQAQARGHTFAEVATRLLLQGQADAAEDAMPDGLDGALAYRMEVYQAQGMVIVDLNCNADEAMSRLRAHAFATGQEIAVVAREVIDGVLRLERDSP